MNGISTRNYVDNTKIIIAKQKVNNLGELTLRQVSFCSALKLKGGHQEYQLESKISERKQKNIFKILKTIFKMTIL